MNINNFKVTQYIYAPIHSIVSKPRQFITAALSVYASSLTGDFVETGVFRGGTSIIMARVLRDLAPEKKLFACDSFQGLPRIQKEDKPNKNCKRCNIGFVGQFSSSRKNFESYVQSEKLNNVKVIEGFYHVTLPPPSLQQISFLRLDGDIYNSTMTALEQLFPLVVPNGAIYIDDYGSYFGCRNAVDTFISTNRINTTLKHVIEPNGKIEAVWFLK